MNKQQLVNELARLQRVISQLESALESQKRAEKRRRYASVHDELTGLHNRAYFDEEMARLGRGRQFPITVIVADLDGLKQVNDTSGHAAGDELLRRAAVVLKETFRAEEIIARIGGDEFVVLLPLTDVASAELAIDRIRRKLQKHNSMHPDLPVELSLGAATASNSPALVEAFQQADERMYAEKAMHKLEGIDFIPRNMRLIFWRLFQKRSKRGASNESPIRKRIAASRSRTSAPSREIRSRPPVRI